jgi:hypothetical protein
MATLLTPPTLKRVLQGLHDSEITCRIQNEPPAVADQSAVRAERSNLCRSALTSPATPLPALGI